LIRKKLIPAAIVAVIASLSLSSVASAKVERCAATTVTDTGPKTATFTVNQPKDAVSQYTNVWRHEYEGAINPDGTSFVGTGKIYDNGAADTTWTETVTGSIIDGKLSMQTTPVGGGATFKVTNAPYNTPVDVETTWTANIVEFMISTPDIKSETTTSLESVKNHGQYVKALGGGKEAAQACAGMPLNSTQGKK